MVNKIIYYFSQCKDILKGLVVLVLVITFILSFLGTKTRVEFKGGCLKQDKVIYDHGKVVNIYTVCNLNCLFDAVSLTKNADNDKYFGYVFNLIDTDFFFLTPQWWNWQKCNNLWSRYEVTKIDNRKKDILIPGKGPTEGL